MSDPLLFLGEDGFDLEVINGQVSVGSGLQNAATISILGGNETGDFWGNLLDGDKIESQTLQFISTHALTSSALLQLRDLIISDLQWMITEKIADSVDAEITAIGANRTNVTLFINGGQAQKFQLNWGTIP